ncbi:MAG: PPOX class F420-dependent oxidoreductase [Nostocoides sp.]
MTTDPQLIDMVVAAKYVALTTWRRNGAAVTTPVWIARDGDELVVISEANVGKTKRLNRGGPVALQPCSMRGELMAGAPVINGTGRVVRDAADVKAVQRAIRAKYPEARMAGYFQSLLPFVFARTPRAGIRISF